jgi:hypothetical protein
MLLRLVAFLFLVAIAGLWSVSGAGASAVARADLPADIVAWLALMPELATAPAPPWLKVGARLTYHVMSAAREGDASPAGESLVQYDVVSLDAATVLAAAGVHVIASGGTLGAVRDTGFIVGAPGVGDVWMDPAALRKAERHASQNLTIAHVTMDVGGVATKAVRFEYVQGAARSVSVFDETAGVLLYRIQASGGPDAAKQSSVVSEFVSIRQLTPAWTGGSTPSWAAANAVLKYEGAMRVNVGYPTPGPPLAVAMLGRITHSAPAGVCVKWETYLSGRKTEERYSLSPSAIPSSGIFMPQAALAALTAGQVLDTDPITGVTVSVAQPPLNIDGKQLLVLVHESQSFRRLYGYDRQSGTLTYFKETSRDGLAVVEIELRLTGVSR